MWSLMPCLEPVCPEISGALANDIDVLNQLSGWKVAVDIASGISSDDGAVLGTAFRADDTITFSFGKRDSICGRAMNTAERYMWFPWELHRRAGWIISRIRLFWNRKT